MKKFLFSILILVCLLGLCACGQGEAQSSETSLTCGRYVDGVLSDVVLSADGRFEFAYRTFMSAYPSGTFEVKDGKVYATSDRVFSGSVYVFEIIDNETIRFCKDESAEIEVEDGAVYRLKPQE